jgi:hypothetical protein
MKMMFFKYSLPQRQVLEAVAKLLCPEKLTEPQFVNSLYAPAKALIILRKIK